MSIDGLGPILPPVAAAPVEVSLPAAPEEDKSESLQSIAPPKGVDPELWSMLTPDEQTYFAEQTVLGPLTYGPGADSATVSPAPRGQRIDVRA